MAIKKFKLELNTEFGELPKEELNKMLADTFMEKLKTTGVKVTYKLTEVCSWLES